MLSENERIALYTLMEIPGMYTRKLNRIYRMTGSFEEILKTDEADLTARGLWGSRMEKGVFDRFRNDSSFLSVCRETYRSLPSRKVRMIDFSEPEMPERFRQLADPPDAIFVKGRLPDASIPCAAIIGSRKCSDYGSEVARAFGRRLSEAGVQILSGMAMGIDTDALRGGLEGPSGCFGVLGSGVNICYPASSRTVYNRMCGGRGGVLSEYCPDARGLGYHFVTRNRLIAALCDVLLVIEAGEKSGTSITVENALELGRDIFALPGRITDPLGFGCNRLIRDGAQALTCPEDVLEYLGIEGPESRTALSCAVSAGLSEDEKKILSLLGPDPVHIDHLCVNSGLSSADVSVLLDGLEEKGAIRCVSGASFVKRYR